MALLFSKGFDGAEVRRILALPIDQQHLQFQQLPLRGARKLVNPRAGRLAGNLTTRVGLPPTDDSRQTAGELLEVAAMALLRDVPLANLESHSVAQLAADVLAPFPGLLTRPGAAGLFRYGTPDYGARLSPLLGKPIPMGWATTSFDTRHRVGSYGAFAEAYDNLQSGNLIETQRIEGLPRSVTTGQGVASIAHQDQPYLILLMVAFQLLAGGAKLSGRFSVLASEGYFVTGGGPLAIQCAIAAAVEPAMRDCWALKWQHLRERPERLWREGVAGRLHPDFLAIGKPLVDLVGQYLPMSYAEGSPIHPDWPSGHAVIAGVGAGILLASFQDGPVPSLGIISVHAEIRQMAWLMAIGRSWAGIHTRSSLLVGLQLGMLHAQRHLSTLRSQSPEPMQVVQFAGFDGKPVIV